jgi:hypothetical protein
MLALTHIGLQPVELFEARKQLESMDTITSFFWMGGIGHEGIAKGELRKEKTR